MNSTAGSYVLLEAAGAVVGDAFVIKKLRDAGAIILAKASLDEVIPNSFLFNYPSGTYLTSYNSGPASVA